MAKFLNAQELDIRTEERRNYTLNIEKIIIPTAEDMIRDITFIDI